MPQRVPQVSLVLRDLGVAISAVSDFTRTPFDVMSAYAGRGFRSRPGLGTRRDLGHLAK
jgi:hypothetical protein